MVKGKKATKKDDESELKMVYTHGKKRNAIANAVIREGNGTITINRIPIHNIEPKTLRIKIFEPILILGVEKFKNLNIKVRVSGGGSVLLKVTPSTTTEHLAILCNIPHSSVVLRIGAHCSGG